jgi:acetolactate synthase-1/2/3 large subunit
MRSFPADVLIKAAAGPTLAQLAQAVPEAPARRRKALAAELAAEHERRIEAAGEPASGLATNAWVSRCLDAVKGDDAIVFGELGADPSVMQLSSTTSWFGHPISGGLGWGVPAALGAKLAARDRLVVACVGDGSYMFANPVACHQTAAALDLSILTIVFNNEVWNAVRKATRAVYPKGHAAAANDMPLSSLAPSPAYERVIEASGGLGVRVEDAREVPAALRRAVAAVRAGQQVLVNVRVAT